MRRTCPSSCRGVALLVVLGVLVLVLAALASAARVATDVRLAARLERDTRLADDLAEQGLHLAELWLTSTSTSVVLPPDAAVPAVDLVHDVIRLDDELGAELHVTAYDQFALLPCDLPTSSPLWSAVPGEVAAAIARHRARVESIEEIGLDAWSGDRALIVYPLTRSGEPAVFGEGVEIPQSRHMLMSVPTGTALGSCIAPRRLRDGAAININTAPLPVLEAVLRELGRGGLDSVVAARAEGKPASLGAIDPDASRHRQSGLRLVTSSTSWAMRIDARVGLASRSWWVVYARAEGRALGRAGGHSPHRNQWRLVQRLAIK